MATELDVFRIWHDFIRPQNFKMVVCLSAPAGLFVNINTKGDRPGSLPISKQLNPFLDWDSYIECGRTYEFDDYTLNQGLFKGQVDRSYVVGILDRIGRSILLRDADKAAIRTALTSLIP